MFTNIMIYNKQRHSMEKFMSENKDLIGLRFGKLTVLSKAPSILGGITVKRYWGAWECKCDCNKIIIVKTVDLNRGAVKSCGCLYDEFGKVFKPGQKINRLTTISYKDKVWICSCECGNIINVKTGALSSGNTKSCGCLKTEELSSRAYKLIEGRRKNEPRIASARRVWQGYKYKDPECIDFDKFFEKSQENCFYCGIAPNKEYNHFIREGVTSSEKAKKEGLFIYNGLDRVDNTKSHTINNVVTACSMCNHMKSDHSVDDFFNWINKLKTPEFQQINIQKIDLPTNGSLLTSVKCIFYNYRKDTDLTLEEFYSLSQMECFYCGAKNRNHFNRAKTDKKASQKAKDNGDYFYNGIDRINSSLSHIKINIVPSCYFCNAGKSGYSIKEFYNWINRIKQYQSSKIK